MVPANRLLNRAKDPAFVDKAHLCLLRVNVDIDLVGSDFDKDRCQWVATTGQEGMVGLHHCIGQCTVFDVTAVDKDVDIGTI